MQNLNLNTDGVELTVNNDPNRVIRFNPNDILFAQKFYRLVQNYKKMASTYREQAAELDAVTETDEDGVLLNLPDRLEFLKKFCEACYAEIDTLFGEGTSKAAFNGVYNLDAISQFFDGVTPFIKNKRAEKVNKYLPKQSKGRSKK